jgi:hypothetical protein
MRLVEQGIRRGLEGQTDALRMAREALEGMVEYTGKRERWDDNPQYVTAVRDAIDVINAALKETT